MKWFAMPNKVHFLNISKVDAVVFIFFTQFVSTGMIQNMDIEPIPFRGHRIVARANFKP